MNRYVRLLFTILLPPSFYLSGILAGQTLWSWAGFALLFLLYMPLVWLEREWWTYAKYLLVVGLAWSLVLGMRCLDSHSTYDSLLLVPLVLLLVKEQGDQRYFTGTLALITLAVMIAISPDILIASSVFSFTLLLAIAVRAINVHKEANRLSQRHFQELSKVHQELEQAHSLLQEMNIYSMRYAALAERTSLAQDMHDGLGHHLTSLTVQLQAMEIMLPNDPQRAALMIPTLLGITRQAMRELRQTVAAWQEDESGLGLAALRGLVSQCAAHSQLAITFQQDDDLSDWSVEISLALYRILQEALTNIMRHAQATSVTVQVREQEQQVLLTVIDDGHYTEQAGNIPGLGIAGMIARSQSLGGTCTLSQRQPSGLQIQVSLPLVPSPAQAREQGQRASQQRDRLPPPPFPFSEWKQ